MTDAARTTPPEIPPHRVHKIGEAIREFGYTDATDEEVLDCLLALRRGDAEMPHGALGVLIQTLHEAET